MDIIQGKDFKYDKTCVTIGKFDGIHIGHRRILKTLVDLSKQCDYKSVVFTFDFEYFKSDEEKRLNTKEEKKRLLEELGIDILIDFPFDEETKNMSPDEFIEDILVNRLDAKKVIIGENFRFGQGAQGDAETLKKLGATYGFSVYPIPLVKYEGSMVSSTRIRDELSAGHIKEAYEMLNRRI